MRCSRYGAESMYTTSSGTSAPTVYPAPGSTAVSTCTGTETPFQLDLASLTPGSTHVTGTGPANVPILIESQQRMGQILGSGTIGPDGKFDVGVVALVDNDVVGLALGDMTGTNIDPNTYLKNATCYNGPKAALIPQVGYFFDRGQVTSQH